jgi:hypothetical protein
MGTVRRLHVSKRRLTMDGDRVVDERIDPRRPEMVLQGGASVSFTFHQHGE